MTKHRLKTLLALAQAHQKGIQAIHDEIAKMNEPFFEEAGLEATAGMARLVDALTDAVTGRGIRK